MREGARILGDGSHALVRGEGRPLVLIHGVGMDLSMWQPLADILAQTCQVITYDMIGHGTSPKPAGPYCLADFVAQLQRLVLELDLAHFDLLGFSMGGLVAQGFAATRDQRLDHLILLNTVYRRSMAEREAIRQRVVEVRNGGFSASVEAALDRWFTPAYRAANPQVIEATRRHLLANNLDAYAAAYEVFATGDAELAETASGIRASTLVMTGSDDQRSTTAMAAALAADIPLAELVILPGKRHLIPLECPDLLADRILDFLAKANGRKVRHG